MKCPKCNGELVAQLDRGVNMERCQKCQGMWFTPSELDQLENEAYDLGEKGSLFVASQETRFKCPVCSSALKQFDYRFYDLKLECCPDHGYWLDKGEDDRVLELMRQEESHLKEKFTAEDRWSSHIKLLRSPSIMSKLKNLFR